MKKVLLLIVFLTGFSQSVAQAAQFNINIDGKAREYQYKNLSLSFTRQTTDRYRLSTQTIPKIPVQLQIKLGNMHRAVLLPLTSSAIKVSDGYAITVTGKSIYIDASMTLRDPMIKPVNQSIYSFGYVFDGKELNLWSVGRDGIIVASPLYALQLNTIRLSKQPHIFFVVSLPKNKYVEVCKQYGGRILTDLCQF